jgi:diguanylate cyclase (GGDEF)-like protein
LALQDPEKAVNKYEFRCIVRNGEVRNVFMFADFIPGTNQTTASFIDITERKQMEEKLKEMSFRDSLTGLYNRNFFEEEMVRLGNSRYSPIGIVVCDLDGLKFVNDTLGHQSGDQMLIQTADILRQNFRSSDIIARIGGDEFAILLTETDQEMVEQILRRLHQAVHDYNSIEPEIPLSLSMGYALGARGTTDLQALFREADNRMYREKLQREGSARSAILQALTVSMEARDFNTENHCSRMQELAASVARALNLSHDFVNDLYLLARFHDLGKVGIPDQILFKPGSLTEEEWRQMRQHSEIGHRIASSVPDLEPIANWILKHHECWDGQGYPLGLEGHDIPLACRILAIVDAYDAMTSDRPYRKAMTREEAITELRRCAGTQFDPELVEQFIQIVEQNDSE